MAQNLEETNSQTHRSKLIEIVQAGGMRDHHTNGILQNEGIMNQVVTVHGSAVFDFQKILKSRFAGESSVVFESLSEKYSLTRKGLTAKRAYEKFHEFSSV